MSSFPEVLLSDTMTVAAAALAAHAGPTPSRSFISHGAPSVDWAAAARGVADEVQLFVYSGTLVARPFGERRAGSPGEQQIVGMTTVMPLVVELWECYPNLNDAGGAPEPAAITTASLRLSRAAWAIWTALCTARDAGTLYGPSDTAEGVVAREDIGIGSMTPLPPSGYMAGWRITLEVGLAAKFGT